ncbi:hypothetical protein [Paenibacillus bovis]|uniref:Uncharacterized protein n=1 Tax=Paenibacillus bovis TaxID=1616788 RepID=A0A172ZBJ9_9BACL|nr:hypothetical protein [Paenibacillus bovis]ANF94998.1 hypothetical protein AR543_02425 [Paenibacillus bovis]
MKNKLYITSLFILLLASILFGIRTAFSYNFNISLGNHLDKNNVKLNLEEEKNHLGIYFNNNIEQFSQIYNEADLVAEVETTSERLNYAQTIKTGIKAIKIFKGKDLLANNQAYIYEPSYFFGDNYFSFGGYQILKPRKTYIVFLKKLKVPKNYVYKADEDISFIPVSSYYSKFELGNSKTKLLDQTDVDNGMDYKKVKEYEILTTSENKLNKFKELKKEVIEKFNL